MGYIRRLPRFEYLAPLTIAEVCGLLSSHPSETRLLAGGTDLLIQMRHRAATPRFIVGLKNVDELNSIRHQAGGIVIGAMTTIDTLLTSTLIRSRSAILAQAAVSMASPEIRNLATLGGNLAGALPCADYPPALMALDASVKLESKSGARMVSVEEFIPTCGETVRMPNEVLTEIHVPDLPPFSGGVYLKFHDRHSMDLTTTGVAAIVTRDPQVGQIQQARIALASSAPVPLRARKAEAVLAGRTFTEDALDDAALRACEDADPRTSWRATREFRLDLVQALTKRALQQAWHLSAGGASQNGETK